MPLRVLYLHFTGAYGGASRSMIEAVSELSPEHVIPMFITQRGSVCSYFSKLGPVIMARGLTQFDNTRYSYYRGFRWLVLGRELAYLPHTIYALIVAKQRFGKVDIIHVNEVTGSIALLLAKIVFRAPAIIHVRSVARSDERSGRTRVVNYLLRKLAACVIAIDRNVAASLPSRLPVTVIHNSFKLKSEADTEENARALSGLSQTSFKVGFVGNLLKVKGIIELIQSAHILIDRGVDVEFVVIGDDVKPSKGIKSYLLNLLGLQQNTRTEIEHLLEKYELRSNVHLLGFTSNIGQIYRSIDVLCFPSHYDAPGRPIFEAAFFGVPSIVAVQNPYEDTLVDGVTGLAILPKSVSEIVSAIEFLINHPEKCRSMGAAAKTLAEKNFDVVRNSERLLSAYQSASKSL